MFDKRGGQGLYNGPAETQKVARWAKKTVLSARTPVQALTEVEYSLPSIRFVMEWLLNDVNPELANILSNYTHGKEAVKAVLEQIPTSAEKANGSVVQGLLAGGVVQGLSDRFGYDLLEKDDRVNEFAHVLVDLPEPMVDMISTCRFVFVQEDEYFAHFKWFFRDFVGRYKDALELEGGSELLPFQETFPWLKVQVGEPLYLLAAGCLPPCKLRMWARYLFQESQQGLYVPDVDPDMLAVEKELMAFAELEQAMYEAREKAQTED